MKGMTTAEQIRENARRANGEFGEHERSEPQLILTSVDARLSDATTRLNSYIEEMGDPNSPRTWAEIDADINASALEVISLYGERAGWKEVEFEWGEESRLVLKDITHADGTKRPYDYNEPDEDDAYFTSTNVREPSKDMVKTAAGTYTLSIR